MNHDNYDNILDLIMPSTDTVADIQRPKELKQYFEEMSESNKIIMSNLILRGEE
jgi:hypothetical protein